MSKVSLNIKPKGENEVKDAFLDLLRLCKKCNTKENKENVIKAYNFAYDAHKGVKRGTGEPFIMHPIEVARIILVEIGLGVKSVMCALMHDTVEDSEDITVETVEEIFGSKIAAIIDGLTKIKQTNESQTTIQAATFRKMIMSIGKDIRVVLIKLADRLHNMRTLDGMPPNKQMIKAGETLYVYAPLARRLGLNKIGRELENLGFKYYMSDDYNNLMQIVEATEEKRLENIKHFKQKVNNLLEKENINFEIVGIKKSLYATWKKMVNRDSTFEDIHNFYSYRLIFETGNELTERSLCYKIYEIITSDFNAKRGSLQDFVNNPKANGFEALIVDVMNKDGNWHELQILSKRMADVAQRGYSSESNGDVKRRLNERDKWIQEIGNQLVSLNKNPVEFLDNFKLNLFVSEIYVFSPQGEIINLAKGATTLDYAFKIHSQLGFNFAAAKVNNKLVNHLHILKSGDKVEIIDTKNSKPDILWIEDVITARAKISLKNYFKKERANNISTGKDIYIKTLNKLNIIKEDFSFKKLLKVLSVNDEEHLYTKLSKELINKEELSKTLRNLKPNRIFTNFIPNIFKNTNNAIDISNEFSNKIPYAINESENNSDFIIAPCCNPIPGDKSIAHKTHNNEITIHQINCENAIKLNAEDGKATSQVNWSEHKLQIYPAKINIKGIDRKQLLLDILKVISDNMSVNMKTLTMETNNGIYEGKISLYVANLKSLNKLINKIRKIKGITSIVRVQL